MSKELTEEEERTVFRAIMSEVNPEAIAFDGFDEAILGMANRPNMPTVLAYDYSQMIDILMRDSDMTEEDAIEFFEFNIASLWAGPNTPVIISMPDIAVEEIH